MRSSPVREPTFHILSTAHFSRHSFGPLTDSSNLQFPPPQIWLNKFVLTYSLLGKKTREKARANSLNALFSPLQNLVKTRFRVFTVSICNAVRLRTAAVPRWNPDFGNRNDGIPKRTQIIKNLNWVGSTFLKSMDNFSLQQNSRRDGPDGWGVVGDPGLGCKVVNCNKEVSASHRTDGKDSRKPGLESISSHKITITMTQGDDGVPRIK